MLNVFITKFYKLSAFMIVLFTTIFVLLGSVPLVYLVTKFYGVEYGDLHIILSIALPMLLTPPVIATFIKLSKHLKNFQDELEKEVENSKKKDLMLFEQARFVLMGEMLANISHQWKQPLNTIGLSVANARLSKRENLENNFDIIEKNVNYLASTIDDFMSFFDKKTYKQIRDIEDILKEVKSIVDVQIISKNITLEIEGAKSKVWLASSISQVLINLLNNAKDALDENIKDKKISLKFTTKEDGLEIVCCDNGRGINPEIRDKIFDPYFTTKHKTQGTGIGLYMSKQIVQKVFDGDICFEDKFFYINLPYSDKCLLKKGVV
ncbi:MAG: HAMP domain-containing sensor histidine kinase [Sulfurimonas sp.]|jgi:signal transduction histidine kinase|nr:HAMP domain-containing sensor histidine kinase [Sulfurimonas sp.]